MTLLEDLRKLREERLELVGELAERIGHATETIERLIAQNQADAEARAELDAEVAVLDDQIARLSEHEPAAEVAEPKPTPTESRRQAMELVRERREAEEEQKAQRRQKPKPDPIKAARKAAKRAEEAKAENRARAEGHYSLNPLVVHTQTADTHGRRSPSGMKRTRLNGLRVSDIDTSKFTPTDYARADLLHDLLAENGGHLDQQTLGREWKNLLDIAKDGTAASQVSRLLRVLVSQRRVVFVGKTNRPGSTREDIAVWKTYEVATPPERAAAGLSIDDEADPKTTNWPNAATTPGLGRVTIESSRFEGKR